ncbi:hypothetical protein [Actinokineospora inagensis]|uniref:hypothetical protein n=1 Tax=Actinokineospora inagensis TaxID=103730 RepID=UPI00047EB6FA|nr:hypothetical protein [Actinokineospora inagensis]
MDDFEARLTAVERELRAVRQDAAAARVLAGGADRDVSALTARLDAQTRLLSALRETQVEHGQQLGTLEAEVRRGFTALATGQAEISTLLQRLASKDN